VDDSAHSRSVCPPWMRSAACHMLRAVA
jgi:hypothetical protein